MFQKIQSSSDPDDSGDRPQNSSSPLSRTASTIMKADVDSSWANDNRMILPAPTNYKKSEKETCQDIPMTHENNDSRQLRPKEFDVICGRGREAFDHTGNRHLRSLVKAQVRKYSRAKTRPDRTRIVSGIIKSIQSKGSAGFVKKDEKTGVWEKVEDKLVREKIGQLLRNSLGGQFKSCGPKKHLRRVAANSQLTEQLVQKMNSNPTVGNVLNTFYRDVANSDPLSLSDEAALEIFDRHNKILLESIKSEKVLSETCHAMIH